MWTYCPYGKYYVINCVILNAIYYINLLVLNRICTIYEYLTGLFINHNMVILSCVVVVYTECKERKSLSCTNCGITKLCPNIRTQRGLGKCCVNLVIIKFVVQATLVKNEYVSLHMKQLNNICIISDFLCDYKRQIKLPVKHHMLKHTGPPLSCTNCDSVRKYNAWTFFLDIYLKYILLLSLWYGLINMGAIRCLFSKMNIKIIDNYIILSLIFNNSKISEVAQTNENKMHHMGQVVTYSMSCMS